MTNDSRPKPRPWLNEVESSAVEFPDFDLEITTLFLANVSRLIKIRKVNLNLQNVKLMLLPRAVSNLSIRKYKD